MTSPNPIAPPSVILVGESGSGKTYSLHTLLEAGLEVFVIGTDPNTMDTLLDVVHEKKLPIEKLHWHSIKGEGDSIDDLIEAATKAHNLSYEDLAKIKTGIARPKMNDFMEVLLNIKDFHDDRTGKSFGDATDWDDSRVLVIDSLTGLNRFARQYVAGLKPNLHQGEWGTAMDLEGNLIHRLCKNRGCYFVLISHLDRSVDEITQATKLQVKALGNKLAPEMIKDFSEIILAKRGTDKEPFRWSTVDATATVKNRALAMSASLPPTFKPIVEAHKRRVAQSNPKAA